MFKNNFFGQTVLGECYLHTAKKFITITVILFIMNDSD
jgi:hypothetical protein